MLNRDVFVKDPGVNQLLNNGVATVTDGRSESELRTLRYELETFVCDGEYERGLKKILETFLENLSTIDKPGASEQPGVWVSGFFGSGKSHLVKMLRVLWTDFVFTQDGATARGLAKLPSSIQELFREISTESRRLGHLHAASGTLGAEVNDNIRLALLSIIFKSADLPEQYPLARFVMWLRDEGHLDAVRSAVEASGHDWLKELRSLYVSPHIANALIAVYPDFAADASSARQLLKEQFPNVRDITNVQMVDGIRDALTKDGKFPLTLVVLDEVQQFIEAHSGSAYKVQEVTEACCKRFAGRILFVGTGQTALSGTELLSKLMGRFQVPIELSDTDVEAVIRKVILQKKADRKSTIESSIPLGEISRHLQSTKLAHRTEDRDVLVADYPLLPVRRRFWKKVLRAVDQGGTAGQLRNQLKVIHEATRATAQEQLGVVVGGDFIFGQEAAHMLQTGVLSREIYEFVKELESGGDDEQMKARLCGLIFLVGKLPRDPGADTGLRATADALADLLVTDLRQGSAELRKRIPVLLEELEESSKVMRVGDEYRMQTQESSAWNDEYRKQLSQIMGAPQRIASEHLDLLRKECGTRLKKATTITHGGCRAQRSMSVHYGPDLPADVDSKIYIWIRSGWDASESDVRSDATAAGNDASTIYVHLPKRNADDLKATLGRLRAAEATLQVRGLRSTPEGEEARRSMETRQSLAEKQLVGLVDQIFSGARVFQAGGQEVVETSMADMILKAGESSVVRMFPQFHLADHAKWHKVAERARKGDGAALAAVDFKGDADKHSVTKTLLAEVGSGKLGSQLRGKFEDSPFGWPRDAVTAGVCVLVQTGALRATDGGQALGVKDLDGARFTKTRFNVESVTVSVKQRLRVRKLLQDLGVPYQSGQEAAALPALIQLMRDRAAGGGGEAPRPEAPKTTLIDSITIKAGNEQVVAIAGTDKGVEPIVPGAHEELRKSAKSWADAAKAIAARLPRWTRLADLLSQAEGHFDEAEGVATQVEAIRVQRLLLDDPDPVPALCDQLCAPLRQALMDAHATYSKKHEKGMMLLKADESWLKLTPEQKHRILKPKGLTVVPSVTTGTEDEVLRSLQQVELATWADRTAALGGRFRQALLEAADLIEPKMVYFTIERKKLASEAEITAWVRDLENRLLEQWRSADGAPVMVDTEA